MLEELLNKTLGKEAHPHSEFLKYLENFKDDQKGGIYYVDPNSRDLVRRDLRAIVSAWDKYARTHFQRGLTSIGD